VFGISVTLILGLGLAVGEPPLAEDPFEATARWYVPLNLKRALPESPATLVKDLKNVLPAILDVLPLEGMEARLVQEREKILRDAPGRYDQGFRFKVSEDERVNHYRSVSIHVQGYPTYREAERALGQDLAGLPAIFEKCSGSSAAVGELCYENTWEKVLQLRLLRKNVVVVIAVKYSHELKAGGPPRFVAGPAVNDSQALCREAAAKIDEILTRYRPPA
jgi:hypothetical protein